MCTPLVLSFGCPHEKINTKLDALTELLLSTTAHKLPPAVRMYLLMEANIEAQTELPR